MGSVATQLRGEYFSGVENFSRNFSILGRGTSSKRPKNLIRD